MRKICFTCAPSAMLLALCLLGAMLLAFRFPAEAQPEKVRIVGRISSGSASAPISAANFEAFRQSLRELGWIEGKNLTIEARWAGTGLDRFGPLAAELVRLRPDVIVAAGSAPTRALKEATATIPIVMAASGDPLSQGLVSSLAKPGGNITGLSLLTPELAGKRLELLTEVVPDAKRMRDLQRIVDLVLKHRLPAMYPWRSYTEVGGLMAYGTSLSDIHRRSAYYVDKILRGTKPADLPVEQPKKFEFIINLKTAKQIGLTIPPNVLARADRVIR